MHRRQVPERVPSLSSLNRNVDPILGTTTTSTGTSELDKSAFRRDANDRYDLPSHRLPIFRGCLMRRLRSIRKFVGKMIQLIQTIFLSAAISVDDQRNDYQAICR
jgi:hypothetical protein